MVCDACRGLGCCNCPAGSPGCRRYEAEARALVTKGFGYHKQDEGTGGAYPAGADSGGEVGSTTWEALVEFARTYLGLMGVESPTLVQVIAALGDYLRELENNEQLQAEKAARARLRVFNRQVRRQLG